MDVPTAMRLKNFQQWSYNKVAIQLTFENPPTASYNNNTTKKYHLHNTVTSILISMLINDKHQVCMAFERIPGVLFHRKYPWARYN